MKTIISGLAVEYDDRGSGPVLLMLHGWQDSYQTFDTLAARFPGFRIVRLDLPGFGGSDIPHEAWSVGDYASFVQSFLMKISIAPDIILGHSFGGRVAIVGIARGLFAPRSLVLLDSGGIAKTHTARTRLFRLVAKVGKACVSLLPAELRERLKRRLYRATQSDYLAAGPLRETFVRVITEDLRADASRICIPTLIVWGEDDMVTPLADAHCFAAAIHGSRLVVIPRAGHFVHRDAPEEVARAVLTFV